MTPNEFQQEMCKRILDRLNSQGHHPKGVKRDRAAVELLCGAAYALEVTGSDQLKPFIMFTVIACSRNASVVVQSMAETGNI